MTKSAAMAQPKAPSGAEDVVRSLIRSIDTAHRSDRPYTHWVMRNCVPADILQELIALPFPAPALDGLSGKRELHNKTRKYVDMDNRAAFPACEALAQAFQDERVTNHIETEFGTELSGTYLRIEYAQDTNGFWLEPHSDLGVKAFTMLLYLSSGEGHQDLGTDIYDAHKRHVGRSPFAPNVAMVFIPADNTFHGFEPRQINGVRQSVIINYVTNEWRAREQLAFPEQPIA
jgi:hypothetical protein